MSRSSVGSGRHTVLVRSPVSAFLSILFAILLGSFLRNEPIAADDGYAAPSFTAARAFDAGRLPFSVAKGDLNGDGKPDLAVANWGNVSVLLNTGASAGIHLGVVRSNTNVTLSWPLPQADFVLESTTSLSSTNWQRAVEAPTTNNGRLEVTAPLNQQGRFFRLRKP